MLRKLTYITIAPMLLVLSLFLLTATPFYYNYEFEKTRIYDKVDIPAAEMPKVIDHMRGYLIGTESEFNHQVMIGGVLTDVYGEREILHMEDVRVIFDYAKYFLIGSALLTFLTVRRERKRGGLRQYLKHLSTAGYVGIFVITVILLYLVVMDFSATFVQFHHMFFTNDLWLLNPKTDRLIQMLPEVFFRDAALLIILMTFLMASAFKFIVFIAPMFSRSPYDKRISR